MNGYEFILILDGGISDENAEAISKRYQETITQAGGQIVGCELWGHRKLAYPIKKKLFGIYYVLYFTGPSDTIRQINDKVTFDEFVLKSMVTKCDDVNEELAMFKTILDDPKVYANLYLDTKKGD